MTYKTGRRIWLEVRTVSPGKKLHQNDSTSPAMTSEGWLLLRESGESA